MTDTIDGHRRERPLFPEGYGLPPTTDGMLTWPEVEARLVAATAY
jgi:hypothetical protein